MFTDAIDPHGDQEQRDLDPGRADGGHRVRARAGRADRADRLGERVQDRALHAARDLALRRRRDLADRVHAGPGPGRAERRARRRSRHLRQAGRAARRPAAAEGMSAEVRAHEAARGGRHGAARPDGHRVRGRAVERQAGGEPDSPRRGRSPASSGATSSPGGGEPGVVEKRRASGSPASRSHLLKDGDRRSARRTTADDGSFAFEDVSGGGYTAQVAPETFRQPWNGVEWLGPKLDHAVDHHRVPLDRRRVRDGHHRRGSLGDPA